MLHQKVCSLCLLPKHLSEFTKRRASPDGLAYICRSCNADKAERWRQENPGAHAKWYQRNADHKRDYWQRWRSANGDRARECYRRWAGVNGDKVNANAAQRLAIKLRATPAWASRKAVRAFYREAARLTRETGIRHDVDHIVPLRSARVCGLHCEANLQILPHVENLKKSNRSWPWMLGDRRWQTTSAHSRSASPSPCVAGAVHAPIVPGLRPLHGYERTSTIV